MVVSVFYSRSKQVTMKICLLFSLLCLIKTSYTLTDCTTPNGEAAVCIPIKQCKVFLEVLKDGVRPPESIVDFMRKSNCGFNDGPLVCCGSFNHPREITPPTSNPRQHKNFHLLPTPCGLQDIDDKIPGGAIAQLDEFPWMGLLEFNIEGRRKFLCGATLISSRYALTAAHCVTGRAGNIPYSIRFGEHDLETEIDCGKKFEANQNYELCIEGYQDIDIDRIIVHPKYNIRKTINDIALIRLAKPVEIRSNIRPVCLPLDREEYLPGTRMSVAGWGKTNLTVNSYTNIKLKASLPIVSRVKCNELYLRLNYNNNINITEDQICAGGEVGVDTCQGDSGNALVIAKEGSVPTQWYIEGIVSFGIKECGMLNIPSVFTRVSSFVNWILDNME